MGDCSVNILYLTLVNDASDVRVLQETAMEPTIRTCFTLVNYASDETVVWETDTRESVSTEHYL
jgi:hypothetical protein